MIKFVLSFIMDELGDFKLLTFLIKVVIQNFHIVLPTNILKCHINVL